MWTYIYIYIYVVGERGGGGLKYQANSASVND